MNTAKRPEFNRIIKAYVDIVQQTNPLIGLKRFVGIDRAVTVFKDAKNSKTLDY